MMNSEIWVCLTEEARCLPFALVNQGYDVWLGNNRGNKYSKKSTRLSPTSTEFWNFSMDQFAFHDIPDSIDYILNTTSQQSLSYIGFSQGTAQAFATLSIHPNLNEKVNLFIALAPAMSPAGLSNGIVDALVKTSPDVLFLAFGRRSILSSATMWQSILYPPIFVRLIDMSLKFLFGWHAKNISLSQKLAAYPHLYSFTSTKSVVHWFQIIRNKSFQMYDDDESNAFSIGASNRYYKVAKFPTRNIKTPVVLLYGGSDSLVDIRIMLKELPKHTTAKEIPHFEHLDFLWAQDVDQLVFPHVFDALAYYTNASALAGRIENGTGNGIPRSIGTGSAFSNKTHRRIGSGGLVWTDFEKPSLDYDGASSSEPATPITRAQTQYIRQIQHAAGSPPSPTPAFQLRRSIARASPVAQPEIVNGGDGYEEAEREETTNSDSPDHTSAPLKRVRSYASLGEVSNAGTSSSGVTAKFLSKGINVGASKPSVSGLFRSEELGSGDDKRTPESSRFI